MAVDSWEISGSVCSFGDDEVEHYIVVGTATVWPGWTFDAGELPDPGGRCPEAADSDGVWTDKSSAVWSVVGEFAVGVVRSCCVSLSCRCDLGFLNRRCGLFVTCVVVRRFLVRLLMSLVLVFLVLRRRL